VTKPDAACREMEQLLPWYINGTLSGDEMLDVTRHLHRCTSCRGALVDLLRLRGSIRQALNDWEAGTPDDSPRAKPLAQIALQQLGRRLQVGMIGQLLDDRDEQSRVFAPPADIYTRTVWRWVPDAVRKLLQQPVA